MKSIRFRVMGTYLIIIFITILLFGIGVYTFIRNYYLDSIESTLAKGQDICSDIYNELYYQYDMDSEPDKIGSRFIPYTRAQILLFNIDGVLLYDSTDSYEQKDIPDRELAQLLEGGDVLQRNITRAGERTLSVSRVLKSGEKTIGILKLSTSLEEVYKILGRVMMILSAGGLVIIIIVSVIALMISNTITRPIGKITEHIAAITAGDHKKRKPRRIDDELGTVTKNLNHLAERLDENEKLREQFIESVSHELRTPLTSIKGWIITIKDRRGREPELMEEGIGIIESETDRLAGLVDDLLDFSGHASKAEVFTNTDICELIGYVANQMKPRADRLGILLSFTGDKDRLHVRCDRDRIRQVIINLLDNALKYSRPGDRVYISKKISEGSTEIRVRDTGPGFDPDDVDKIFDKKYRGQNAAEGRGLGLAISKEIVESHGGSIEIETGSSGTDVKFRIPLTGRER